MVMMSNWPPLVAISVVTRWRSTFSSSTTQFNVCPLAASHWGESFCMTIMSELFTVAMVSSSAVASDPNALAANRPIAADRRNLHEGIA